jgi:CRP-like cAMP-binding protein
MDKNVLLEFIQQNISGIAVTKAALGTIADHFEYRAFPKNDFFLREGKAGGYFFLADGFMRAFTYDTEGKEVTTYFYSKDRVVFEVSSFFLHQPSSEYVQAITDCCGFITTIDKLNHLFHSLPEFREFGRMMLIREFITYKKRALSMINRSAEQRYGELLQSHPEIFQHAQLQHIASYLGVTSTSLSRIRRSFAGK